MNFDKCNKKGDKSGYSRIINIEKGGGTFNMSGGTLIGDAVKTGHAGSTGINAYTGDKTKTAVINITGGTIKLNYLNEKIRCAVAVNTGATATIKNTTIKVLKGKAGTIFYADHESSIFYSNNTITYQNGIDLTAGPGKFSTSCG